MRDKYLRPLVAAIEMLIGTALTAAAFGLIIVPRGFAAGGITKLRTTDLDRDLFYMDCNLTRIRLRLHRMGIDI